MLRGTLFAGFLFLFSTSYGDFQNKHHAENSNHTSDAIRLLKNKTFVDLTRMKCVDENETEKKEFKPKKILTIPMILTKKKRWSELPEKQNRAPKRETRDLFKTILNDSEETDSRIYIPGFGRNITWNIGILGNITGVPYKLVSFIKPRNRLPIPVHSNSHPEYFDWRDKSAVSPIKDQQRCQACWAFSAVANIESMLKIYLNQEYTLSEQFLIDCIPDSGGCQGGASLLSVFGYIVSKLGGVLKYDSYEPYTAQQHKCRYTSPPPYPVPVVGMHRVPQDEDAMAEYLYKYGPLSAAINSKSMDDYHTDNGIYIDEPSDKQCPKDQLDHTVLIVGYNIYVDKSSGARVPYWIIKNSWGSNWGDKGFYYLRRGRNACGIASDVSFASVV